MGAGLADGCWLLAHPSVQGRGRRLLPDGHEVPRLELEEARGFGSGVALLRYAPA